MKNILKISVAAILLLINNPVHPLGGPATKDLGGGVTLVDIETEQSQSSADADIQELEKRLSDLQKQIDIPSATEMLRMLRSDKNAYRNAAKLGYVRARLWLLNYEIFQLHALSLKLLLIIRKFDTKESIIKILNALSIIERERERLEEEVENFYGGLTNEMKKQFSTPMGEVSFMQYTLIDIKENINKVRKIAQYKLQTY
jgi:hypothetical protein